MTFEVELGGRTRTIAVARGDQPGRFRVTVDGEPHLLDVSRTGEFGLSVLEKGTGTNSGTATVPFTSPESPEKGTVPPDELVPVPFSRDLHLTPGAAHGELLVSLGGRTVTVTVNGRRTGHAADAAAHRHGDISIVAPMPGRVVRVLVAPGDEVAVRQGVVVVEAMKMENELRAPRAGRVKEISVTPGTSVEAGRVLAVIE
jgi:biotin carboxyl carrier protein